MTQIITDDLTTLRFVPQSIVLQQVNMRHAHGSGVASALRNRFLKEYNFDTRKCYNQLLTDTIEPINRQQWQDCHTLYRITPIEEKIELEDCETIAAVPLLLGFSFSQYDYGDDGKHYTHDALLINNIREICQTHPNQCVYIPYKIGCGLAGAEWNTIYKQIKDLPNLFIVQRECDK